MKVVKISEFKAGRSSIEPRINFRYKGAIALSPSAFKLLAPHLMDAPKVYLHIAYEGEKENHKLFVWIDENPTDGLNIRHPKDRPREEAKEFLGQASALVNHFKELFDWPLGATKKTVIKYGFHPQIIKNEFSDRIFQLS